MASTTRALISFITLAHYFCFLLQPRPSIISDCQKIAFCKLMYCHRLQLAFKMEKYCHKWGMKINCKKSKVMILQNVSEMKDDHKFSINKVPINKRSEVVQTQLVRLKCCPGQYAICIFYCKYRAISYLSPP